MSKKSKTGLDSIIFGVVESIDDPTYSGRIKCRVKGMHDNITTEELPWCSYGGSPISSANGGGSISIARVGLPVRILFKSSDSTSIEWYACNLLDPKLIEEIKDDYEGSLVLLYDSACDLSIKYQTGTGIVIYFQGSFILISPDNSITLHYGKGATGTLIQLSEGRVDVQGSQEINLTTQGAVNIDADTIVLNAKTGILMKGNASSETAVNGTKLMTALSILALMIDAKAPVTPGITFSLLNSMKEGIMNQNIQYFK